MNNGPLYIGKDPWHPGVNCYLDELKIFDTALRGKHIFIQLMKFNHMLLYLISYPPQHMQHWVVSLVVFFRL